VAIEEFLILYAPFGTVVLCFCFTVLLLPQTLRVVLKKPLYRFADFLAQDHFVAVVRAVLLNISDDIPA